MTEDRKLAIRLARLVALERDIGCTCIDGKFECMRCHAVRVLGADMPRVPVCSYCRDADAVHVDCKNGLRAMDGECCGSSYCCRVTPYNNPRDGIWTKRRF